MGRRRLPWLALVIVVVAMAWPALRRPPTDGYPLSTYPMFSSDRGPWSEVVTVVGRDPDGAVVRLSPRAIGGTDEPMVAIRTAAIAVGGGHADTYCDEVAGRLGAHPVVVELEVVTERHHAVEYFTAGEDPRERRVHARCAAGGGS